MLFQVHAKAIDHNGDVVTESTFPVGTREQARDYEEEFIDRLERRRVPFARIVLDMAVSSPVRPRHPIRSLIDLTH